MLSKAKRKIYARKMREFWIDFSHNKIGFAGLVLLIFFIFAAIFAPVLAPENPIHQKRVAARYAVPEWLTIFSPELQDKPPTINYPLNVTIAPENSSSPEISVHYPQGSQFVLAYYNEESSLNGTVLYIFDFKFNYTYEEPPAWSMEAHWQANSNNLSYRIEIYFLSPNGSEWIIWGKDYDIVTRRVIVLPQMWNLRDGSLRVESGSTYLKRRLYYEDFYQKLLPYYLEKYSFINITFPREFVAFTEKGFKNFTSRQSLQSVEDPDQMIENPIYTYYKNLKQKGETNLTWIEYWETWTNSEDYNLTWNTISEFVHERWEKWVSAFMLPQFTVYVDENVTATNTIYLAWYRGYKILGTDTPYNSVPWEEIATILNLTLSEELANYTVIDLLNIYQSDISNATEANPAYQRWINLPENVTISWDDYWKLWVDIQYYTGRTAFFNRYLKSIRLGPELAEEYAKKEAYNFAATSPTPTYYLATKGTQTIRLHLYVIPKGKNANLTITFRRSRFTVWGARHGLLGTNSFGFDVWTQLVHGARISLVVGSLAALISTSLGIFFGVLAGYVGGIADEITMRIVDVLLCLPVLPLLLALSSYFKPNVYYLVIIIAIFGWQGLSRVIRSRVLTLRELPFIESARASGASSSYLLIRHLIPNVFPIAMASLVLSVPGAILTEAALSFLGFGDPFAPTWGKMLHEAQSEGSFHALAWWYIVPPGLAITFLCVAFVFIGHALDEIVNPRLRRRR
jgi:ABC-type dipeptide/oligopeptide/nickel transport system permease subunit